MNKRQKILLIISFILILSGLCFKAPSHYATIKGEDFTIPKIEGEYYYER